MLRAGYDQTFEQLADQTPAGGSRLGLGYLIDPATGQPARSGLAAVTIVAAQGWQAEVLAKAAFLGGLRHGPALLTATRTDGLLVDDRGGLHPTAGFQRFTVDAGPPDGTVQEVAG